MTERVKKIYKSGIKNNEFLLDIKLADGYEKPDLFDSDEIKTIFATVYYGWLVGKYGKDWSQNL